MPKEKLTREDVALTVLNGIMASMVDPNNTGAVSILAGPKEEEDRMKACLLAFKMADCFIKVRDMNP